MHESRCGMVGKGEAVTLEAYLRIEREASLLKLRAGRQEALRKTWKAVVLYHRAAYLESLAALELSDGDVVARVRALVEATGLYINARDPPAAIATWRMIPEGVLESNEARALTRRVSSVLHATQSGFASHWREFSRTLGSHRSFEGVRSAPLERILLRYPGVPGFWWASYRYFEKRSEWVSAASSLHRALELDPENQSYESMALLLESHLRRPCDALLRCRARWTRRRDSAAVNQTYALVLLRLTRGTVRRDYLPDLDSATADAVRLSAGTGLELNAKRLRSYVETLLVRRPTVQDFERLQVAVASKVRMAARKPKLAVFEEAMIAAWAPRPEDGTDRIAEVAA